MVAIVLEIQELSATKEFIKRRLISIDKEIKSKERILGE